MVGFIFSCTFFGGGGGGGGGEGKFTTAFFNLCFPSGIQFYFVDLYQGISNIDEMGW